MVYNFLCKDEKTRRNIYLLLLKTSVWKEVRHFSVQCILTETTWLPTLIFLICDAVLFDKGLVTDLISDQPRFGN